MLNEESKDIDQGLLVDGSHITVIAGGNENSSSMRKAQPMWVYQMMNLPAAAQQRLAKKIQDLNRQFEDRE